MRQIKFRGLRVDGKGWVYGSLVQDAQGKFRIYWKPFEEATSNTYHFVIPESVGQLIMVNNGVDIYEGDIDKILGKIFYFDGAFFVGKNISKAVLLHTEYPLIKIIGNIHEELTT